MSDKQTEIEHEQNNIEDEQSLSRTRERNRTLDWQGIDLERSPKCPLCNAQHWLSHCKEFKSICNNCLVPGHFFKFCPKDSFCRVTGCEVLAKHPFSLHPKPGRTIANPVSGVGEASSIVAAQQVDDQRAVNGFVRGRSEAIGSKIEHGQESATTLASSQS